MNAGGQASALTSQAAGSSGLDSPSSVSSRQNIGKLGYAIAISIGILILISTITIFSYFCTRAATRDNPPPRRRRRGAVDVNDETTETGFDDAVIKSWPKVTFAEAKHRDPRVAGSCCSVCLADYGDDEVLRLLPECGHLFHERCVDPWLRRRPTCPVCRSSPAPSPLSTPLADVVPLASLPI